MKEVEIERKFVSRRRTPEEKGAIVILTYAIFYLRRVVMENWFQFWCG
jgi:hypothetical protein